MSLRRHILRAVGLLTAVAMVFGALAGTAVAKKASHKQKVRAQLLRAVKKNPRIVTKKSFLKKASLVNFTLPVTIRLRGTNNNTPASPFFASSSFGGNPNSATVNLGTSLGNRQVSLAGSLPAEVQFNDAYDGGALGNVRIAILEGGAGLTTSSIPLLWNANTNNPAKPWWGAGLDFTGDADDGCGGFTGDTSLVFTPLAAMAAAGGFSYTDGIPAFTSSPFPGPTSLLVDPDQELGNALQFQQQLFTYVLTGNPAAATAGGPFISGVTVPEAPGVDSLAKLTATGHLTPGPNDAAFGLNIINNVGLNPDPFPIPFNDPLVNTNTNDPNYDPLASTSAPNVQNTVLRTNNINLTVAHQGTSVNQTADLVTTGPPSGQVDEGTRGVDGSQNIVIGKSGGQANLFGNIPGRGAGYGIDVTVSLQGKIQSILREVDPDFSALVIGAEFPPAAFLCRQAITGGVQNYFAGVRLKGSLTIAPAITKDGRLRIAKAVVSSLQPTDISVAACLYPHELFAAEAPGTNSDTLTSGNVVPTLPINPLAYHTPVASTVNCKDTATKLVETAGVNAANFSRLIQPAGTVPYTPNADGSRVSVSAALNVTKVSVDVLIGRNEQ